MGIAITFIISGSLLCTIATRVSPLYGFYYNNVKNLLEPSEQSNTATKNIYWVDNILHYVRRNIVDKTPKKYVVELITMLIFAVLTFALGVALIYLKGANII